MSERQFFDEKEAEEILRLAARTQNPLGGVSRTELLKTAAELGISPEALADAEAQIRLKQLDEADKRAFAKHQWNELLGHLGTYAAICAGLVAVDYFQDRNLSWAYWPVGIWGIILVGQILAGLVGFGREEEFAKWKRRQERRARSERTSIEDEIEDIAEEMDIEDDRMDAVRELRKRTGMDFQQSKEAIDEYLRQSD